MKYPYSSDVISEFGSVRVITPSFNELITIISDLVSTSIYAAVTVPFSIEYFTENISPSTTTVIFSSSSIVACAAILGADFIIPLSKSNVASASMLLYLASIVYVPDSFQSPPSPDCIIDVNSLLLSGEI